MTLRVMTFNIRGAVPGRDGMNAWEHRALLNTAVEGEHFSPICRCDWILTRDGACSFKVHSCEVLRDATPPIYPSDHYPVLAELTLIS